MIMNFSIHSVENFFFVNYLIIKKQNVLKYILYVKNALLLELLSGKKKSMFIENMILNM